MKKIFFCLLLTMLLFYPALSFAQDNVIYGLPKEAVGQSISQSHEPLDDEIGGYKYRVTKRDPLTRYAEFTYEGKEYLLNIGSSGRSMPYRETEQNWPLATDEYAMIGFDIGVFTRLDRDEYTRVIDKDILKGIKEAFGDSLTVDIIADRYPRYNPGNTVPDLMPEVFEFLSSNEYDSLGGIVLKLGHENRGTYMVIVSGEIDGRLISSPLDYFWVPEQIIEFSYDENDEADFIAQANSFLKNHRPKARDYIRINCPEGEFYGYINVPFDSLEVMVEIIGKQDESGHLLTIIHGGVTTQTRLTTIVQYVHFIGAGQKDGVYLKNWKDTINEGKQNLAFTGKRANVYDCIFEGYDCALMGSPYIKTGTNNIFTYNNTAIYLDGYINGNNELGGNIFIRNNTALDITFVRDDYPLSVFDLRQCAFMDNKIDVHNRTDKNLFLPGCYFAQTDESGELSIRECRYLPVAGNNLDKKVLYYPQAKDRSFTSFIYDTGFYHLDPVISINFSDTFDFPSNILYDAQLTLASNDSMLARIRYEEPYYGYTPRTSSDESVSPMIDIARSKDGGSIEVTMSGISADMSTVISIPCDPSWKKAYAVNAASDAIPTKISDGFINFTVTSSGKYLISKAPIKDSSSMHRYPHITPDRPIFDPYKHPTNVLIPIRE